MMRPERQGDAWWNLYIDFETRSTVDLKRAGVHAYVTHPTTDVWCCAWAIKNGPIGIWRPGEMLPQQLWDALMARRSRVCAHNAGFEWNVIEHICAPRYGWPRIPYTKLDDTAARAAMMAMPRSLEQAAQAAGLRVEKDMKGHALMLRMARPRRIEDDGTIVWWTDDERVQRLEDYCRKDVEVERALDHALMWLLKYERSIWKLDFVMNHFRGVQVDLDLVHKAGRVCVAAKAEYDKRLRHITGGAVTGVNKTTDLRQWINDRGVDVDSVDKHAVMRLLAGGKLPDDVRAALELRRDAAKSSTAKLSAFVDRTTPDGRMYDNLMYYGASTGRFSGRGAQLHNLPRPSLKRNEVALAIEILKSDAPVREKVDTLELMFGSPLTAVSDCLRGVLIAKPGHILRVADYSNIEGRVNAWAAGDNEKCALFARGGKIYERMGASIYGVPVDSVTKDGPERWLGKKAELGCFAADTLVVCRDRHTRQTHYKPIVCVTDRDQLWDGVEWVSHKGVLDRGTREVVEVDGVRATADHSVLCGKTWRPVSALAQSESIQRLALETGSAHLPSPASYSVSGADSRRFWSSAFAGMSSIASTHTTFAKAQLVAAGSVPSRRACAPASTIGATPTLCPGRQIGRGFLTAYRRASDAAITPRQDSSRHTAAAEYTFTRPGARTGERFSGISQRWTGGTFLASNWIVSTMTAAMSRAISVSSRKLKTRVTVALWRGCNRASSNSNKRTRVYDIALAGPRNRFTIASKSGHLIVHNCGYGMGAPKFKSACADEGVDITDELAQTTIDTYRQVNHKIVRFWTELNDAALQAVRVRGEWCEVGPLFYLFPNLDDPKHHPDCMIAALPSGRHIFYPFPRIEMVKTPWGTKQATVTYMTVNSITRKWERRKLYGGLLCENAVQAMARDILCEAMIRLERAGYPVVLTIHDEIICECPVDKGSQAEFERLMAQPPEWAEGCPIAVEGFEAERYRK